mmetsp:Transcript_129540/g.242342  ORF Transcript_129540/g.242342 Transcript_129540/m.242342 type:complete len:542 (+) Transcript_129540:59-1684(+)
MHGLTLGVLSGCLLLGLLGTTGSGLPAETNNAAGSPVLIRREAEAAVNSDRVALELSPSGIMQQRAKTNITDHLPKSNMKNHLAKAYYTVIAPDAECTAEYFVRTQGTTPESCAQECMVEPGCGIFSFRGGHNGCRISMCGNLYARKRTGVGCGKSDGKVLSVKSGCGTGSSPGSSLYAVTASSRLMQRVEKGRSKPIAPYQMLQRNSECGKHYQTAVAADAGECAVMCSKAAGCWAFSFSDRDGDCRLSACLYSKAVNAEGECGASPGSGRLGLSTQCAVEESANASMYLILQMNVIAKDAGCIGQYKHMQGVSSVYECRRWCIAHESCRIFSYGTTNGCRISACSNASVNGPCDWTVQQSKSAAGFANGENTNMTLADAKARCLQLGKNTCRAITCYPNDKECSVRHSGTAREGLLDETTHVPAAACYEAAVQGVGHQCGASDESVFASEGQCFLGASPGDYVYDIPTKMVRTQTRARKRVAPDAHVQRNTSYKHPLRPPGWQHPTPRTPENEEKYRPTTKLASIPQPPKKNHQLFYRR